MQEQDRFGRAWFRDSCEAFQNVSLGLFGISERFDMADDLPQ